MKTIAVVFGGQSTEHDVSIITALTSVIKPLELNGKYKVEAVYIDKNGSWYWDDKLKDIKIYQSGEIEAYTVKAPKVHLLFDNGLTLVKSSQFAGRKLYRKIDVVFPAMHGTHGEDGELMGLLEMANVAYVGCNPEASVIAMDKVLAKQVTHSADIPSTPWAAGFAHELAHNPTEVHKQINKLKYPLFVKPAHLGSSIGISKIDKPDQLNNALEVAVHFDDKFIVEQAVNNLIEVTLPIIGNDKLTPALLERPLTNPEDFFDFDTKYMQGGKKGKGKTGAQGYSEIPAKLSTSLYKKAEQLGLDVYRAIGCAGIARVDMLIDSKTQKVYFNEVNPLPGGLYAHNWRKAGMPTIELVEKLVELAEARHTQKQRNQTSFNTNYLKQF